MLLFVMIDFMDCGVIVASDSREEWLLPWWWDNYHLKNSLPVCCADFGMYNKAKKWCRKRGHLVKIPHFKIAQKEQIDSKILLEWEKCLSPFWESRNAWFKKPFALLKSPFEKSLWLDLDCEVMSPLNSIFAHLKSQIAIVKVRTTDEGINLYNSGVIAYKKNAPIIHLWAKISYNQSHLFLSDQDALSHIIHHEKIPVDELPETYNWLMCRGLNTNAKILHWAASWGKEYIRKHGGLKNSLSKLFFSPCGK